MKKKKNVFSSFATAESIKYSIVMPIVLCLLIGIFLDKRFNFRGLFTMLFTVLGAITSLYNVYKLAGEKSDKN